MGLTVDPDDPGLHTTKSDGQHEKYLISREVFDPQVKFVRPVRTSYRHTTCQTVTHMAKFLAETYAKNPKYYGATWCCGCGAHCPVAEFVWDGTEDQVGS